MTKFSPNPAGHCARVLLAASAVLAGSLIALPPAFAQAECTQNNWSQTFGTIDTATPRQGVTRYTSFCAAMMSAGTEAWVQDNNPNGIDRIRAQFYVLNDLEAGEGAPLIYAGFGDTDGSNRRFWVRLAPSGLVTLFDQASGERVQQSGSSKWLSIQIDWQQGSSGSGSISLSVNGQEPVTKNSLSNASLPLQSVRLGILNLNPTGAGTLNFDAYQSHRTTPIPLLESCNPTGTPGVGATDRIQQRNEILGVESFLAAGQPDCNDDGQLNSQDRILLRNKILGI